MGATLSYRLKHLIGVGSFAEVWQAERVGVDRVRCADDVAVKIGRYHEHDDKSRREEQFALYTAPLELAGFIQVIEVTSYHERLVIVLELAQESLLSMARRGNLSVFETARLIGEAGAALDALHARVLPNGRRLFHGSINPTDILIRDGHAKVSDLGPYPIGPPTSIPLYKAACMPPEFWWKPLAQVLPQSDQYVLAASYVWSRLPDGPFGIPPKGALLSAIEIGRVSRSESEVLLRAMNAQPQDRFPSCTDFAVALKKAL